MRRCGMVGAQFLNGVESKFGLGKMRKIALGLAKQKTINHSAAIGESTKWD